MSKSINVTSTNMADLVFDAYYYETKFKEGEDTSGAVEVKHILWNNVIKFHPKRLEEQRKLITALVNELPETFKDEDGDVFLNLSFTKEGKQWALSYSTLASLVVMAIALGLMECLVPRTKKEEKHIEYRRFRIK